MSIKDESTTKSERIEARVSIEQKTLFQRAAELSGVSLSVFAIMSLAESAHRIIQEREIINLSASDQRAFAHALLDPPPPSKKLLDAKKNRQSFPK